MLGGLWTARDLIRRSPAQPLGELLLGDLGIIAIGWILGTLVLKAVSKAVAE
ncbi:MAG: hypothetical protein ACYDIE_10995 [Candidatus Krumholzibacteriia bacterium]